MDTATHTDIETLANKVAEALLDRVRPTIPISIDLWDAKMIAAYLKRSERTVAERIAKLPTFPGPVRLPAVGEKKRPESEARSRLLWRAKDVIEWAEQYRDRN